MKLAQALILGGVMTAVSATAGLLSLSIIDSQAAVASTQSEDSPPWRHWSPPEPTSKSLPAVPVVDGRRGIDPVAVLLLTRLSR